METLGLRWVEFDQFQKMSGGKITAMSVISENPGEISLPSGFRPNPNRAPAKGDVGRKSTYVGPWTDREVDLFLVKFYLGFSHVGQRVEVGMGKILLPGIFGC